MVLSLSASHSRAYIYSYFFGGTEVNDLWQAHLESWGILSSNCCASSNAATYMFASKVASDLRVIYFPWDKHGNL